MKKIISLLFVLLLIGSMAACDGNKPAETTDADTAGTEVTETTPYDGPIFFVSPDGNGNGAEETPFAGLDQALARIHELRDGGSTAQYTVNLLPGEYAVSNFTFDAALGGTLEEPTIIQGIGDGEVILNAAKNIPISAFRPLEDEEMKARFYPEAAEKILVCDLGAFGLTADDIHTNYGYGSHTQMPAELCGINTGFFWNDTRLYNARYPNISGEHLYEDQAVIEEGGLLDAENSIIRISGEVYDHVARWKTLDGAMIHDYFMYNWSEGTTTIDSFDPETGAMKLTYRTDYREGGEFWFFNVPEELDAPGEYWVDTENLLMYLYPVDDDSEAIVSVNYRPESMFTGEMFNVTIENLTLEGSGASIIAPEVAEGLTVRNCIIRRYEGTGVTVNYANYNNTVYGCEVYNGGVGGIGLGHGGDLLTLTPSNNVIENNCLHDYAQIRRTYNIGLCVQGCGGKILHNEVYNAPHFVVTGGEMESTIEWNYFHDVVQESDDAGAFYGGGQWHDFGNVISHNKFERVGNPEHTANGIYFDDMISGWTAQYNVLIDVYGYGFMVGGGRNITITNNLIINHGEGGYIYYDDRMRSHYLEGIPVYLDQSTGMWADLNRYPCRTSGIWAEKYPDLAAITYDTSDIDDPNFPINPANSVIKNNIYVGRAVDKWNNIFWDSVLKYSEIGEYMYSADVARIFEEGTYEFNKVGKRAKIEYEVIPYEGYGTYAD